MNPSTEDFVKYAHQIDQAQQVYILPNNSTLCWLLSRLQNCLKANAV